MYYGYYSPGIFSEVALEIEQQRMASAGCGNCCILACERFVQCGGFHINDISPEYSIDTPKK